MSRPFDHDPETGEIRPPAEPESDTRHRNAPRRARGKRPPTAAELEAARIRAERAAHRQRDIAAIRAVDPACEVEGDPPVQWRVPAVIGAEPSGIILELARDSGRGMPGSRVVVARRSYDGTGPSGGNARETVTVFVVFRDGAGHLRRTVGVALHASELRDIADALNASANSLESRRLTGASTI